MDIDFTSVNILVEGKTELFFVKKVLAEHLAPMNIYCTPRLIETSRGHHKGRKFRGGGANYSHWKQDLLRWMKEDKKSGSRFTTMIDLYRLPRDFPDYDLSKKIMDPIKRVECLEKSLKKDMNEPRFIPYIQLHEFEALLLCEPRQFLKHYKDRTKEVNELIASCAYFASPDLINDGASTAPSKRIIDKIPEYENDKTLAGPLIAGYIGIDTLRKNLHFSDWLDELEKLTCRWPVHQ
jgi:hypothetical protein